jgi:N-acetylneuraminic acid mutarotase
MVYDSLTGKVILFGGYDGGFLDDTWAYDPAANTWTELKPSGETPPGRYGQCMVYDPASAKVILFGGDRPWVNPAGRTTTYSLDDLWAYDPVANTWTELEPSGEEPLGRAYSSLVYDYAVNKVILFGGLNGSILLNEFTVLNDTWAYDSSTNSWTELNPCDPRLSADVSVPDTEGGRTPKNLAIGSIFTRTSWQQALPLPASIVPSIH